MAKVSTQICYYPDPRKTVEYPECPYASDDTVGYVVCAHPNARGVSSCACLHMFPKVVNAFHCQFDDGAMYKGAVALAEEQRINI